MRTSRALRTILVTIIAIALFLGCNAALSFGLTPYGSRSELVWSDYAKQDKIDLVFAGTSLCQVGFDPAIVDQVSGTASFNIASSAQSIEDSFAGIQSAYEDYGIRRAVLCISPEALVDENEPDPGSAYLNEMSKVVPLQRSLMFRARSTFLYGAVANEDSINCLFPWLANHVAINPSAIAQNVRMKTDGTTMYEASAVNDPGFNYADKGHGVRTEIVDLNTAYLDNAHFGDDEDPVKDLVPERVRTMNDICAYCAENGIELIGVHLPITEYHILRAGDAYYEQQAAIANLFESNGFTYYDLQVAKPELLELDETCFCDVIHLNDTGCERTSRAFGELLNRIDAGEDVSKLFYTPEEHFASLDYLAAVSIDYETAPGGIVIIGKGYAGDGVDVEYQMSVKRGNAAWEVVQPWSAEPECFYATDEHGVLDIRVQAREVGQPDTERFHDDYAVV